jgi:hypothetical protein
MTAGLESCSAKSRYLCASTNISIIMRDVGGQHVENDRKTRNRWEGNIKRGLNASRCEDVDWIHVD